MKRFERRLDELEDGSGADPDPIELTENQRENLAEFFGIPIEETPETVQTGRPEPLSAAQKELLAEKLDAEPATAIDPR